MKKELLVISAVWCPSCLILNKHLKKIRREYPELEMEKLDYDLDFFEVERYQVGKILPVMILKHDDKEVRRLVGEKSFQEIKEFLSEV